MRLSGVDPSIIRELSGIYKPFVKAFKELLSNAYDADAQRVEVVLDNQFRWMEVRDDGGGMTPYQFHRDFARLGGSTARLKGGRSPGGRPRVGFKGIGFLSVARYCRAIEVESVSAHPFTISREISTGNRKTEDLATLTGDLIELERVRDHVRLQIFVVSNGKRLRLEEGPSKDYEVEQKRVRFRSQRARAAKKHVYKVTIDCSDFVLLARIDFDYLLGMENKASLDQLEEFCELALRERRQEDLQSFTRIRLEGLKDFVVRDLSAPATRGKARNVVFKSGKDRFLWNLARSSPIRDEIPKKTESEHLRKWADAQEAEDFPEVEVTWGHEDPKPLRRPVFLPGKGSQSIDETYRPVNIDEDGLRVEGYILARSEVIYPAELRGISIRVRNVAIGNAGFFGWESILSGPRKAALSQITGELRVHEGLEANDAINPGRESFYEESPHYRLLKHVMTGSGETIGGIVGSAVNDILARIHVRSQVREAVESARSRRRTLGDIAGAVGAFARPGTKEAKNLVGFFRSGSNSCELAQAKTLSMRPGHKLGGFEVEKASGLDTDFEIDFDNRTVRVDYDHDSWGTSVFLHGQFYDVLFKLGRPSQPICEFDNEKRKIYVNWGHPVKQNMDEEGFLKSAILLRLAYHAAPDDADSMMNLALSMMSFRSE